MNRIIIFLIMTAITLNFSAFQAFAQDEDDAEELETVQVKASRTDKPKKTMESSVTIITQEEIQSKQHMQVKDILQEQMGISVFTNGSLGSATSVFMRGAGSSSTLVMIDGVQMNASTTGAFNFGNLQMDNIERIEILRGPQSTLWGADAVGGVINIITKKGKGKPSHFLTFEGGSFATYKETAGSSGKMDNFDYSITVSRTDSDGISSFNEKRGAEENDSYDNSSVSSRLGYDFLEDGRVEFIGRYSKANKEFDGFSFISFKPIDAIDHYTETESYSIATPIQKSATDWWDVKLNPSFAFEELDTKDPTFGDSLIKNKTVTVDLQNNLDLGKYFSSVFGVEHQITKGENITNGFEKENQSQGLYLQGGFDYDDAFLLTAGFRQDYNSEFDNKLTYKVDGTINIKNTGTKIRGGYATGFRAPSTNELLFPFFGNPNIQPEESKNWEVGVDQSLFKDRLRFGTTYFKTKYTNLISFDFVTLIVQNIGKATSEGFESYAKAYLTKDFDVTFTHTWNDAFDDTSNERLVRRPETIYTVALHHNWRKKIDSLISINHRSITESGTDFVDSYTLLRAAVSYMVTDYLKLTARGENLTDKSYEDSFNFGSPGVSGYLGFTYYIN